jgi:hypothetical protein
MMMMMTKQQLISTWMDDNNDGLPSNDDYTAEMRKYKYSLYS